jgi:predicted N-acetyltransferase YhbS
MKSSAPRYLPDEAVTADLDGRLRSLLSACFPDPCFSTRRYCHEMPAHRWIVEDERGGLAAHIAAHDKLIGLRNGDIRVLGIAEVCVRQDFRGHGLVRELVAAAHAWGRAEGFPYAMLFGRPEVYQSSGYTLIANPIRRFDSGRGEWETAPMDYAMICPLHNPTPWPDGEIDIRGPLF